MQIRTQDIAEKSFDVIIVGGGISGAWLSLHCAQNNLKTLLLEQQDYASQTSSASSKLLHGGIRYLQQMQFGKVRESALERAEFMYAAPHLSTAVPFIVPTYPDFKRSKFFLNCGMLAYKTLCIGENKVIDSKEQVLPGSTSISKEQLNKLVDLGDEPHTGGVVFYEQHMLDSERMVLAILRTAQQHGATTLNYASVEGFLGDACNVTGVKVRDQLSGETCEISSKLVINAAGPWIDDLNNNLSHAADAPRISGFAVGSHLVTRKLSNHAIALTTNYQSDAKIDRGGRHVFVIPWRDQSLIGTSYEETEQPEKDMSVTTSQIEQLLDAVNQNIPTANLTSKDIVAAYSGLYPLNTDDIQTSVYQGTGEYRIIDHKQTNGVSGLITALGAKFTTARKLSELSLKLVEKKLGVKLKAKRCKLIGADYQSQQALLLNAIDKHKQQLSEVTISHLCSLYGSEVDEFIELVSKYADWDKPLSSNFSDIAGQVIWAIEKEQATNLQDIVFRRTSLALLGIDQQGIDSIIGVMSKQLNWSEVEQNNQRQQYQQRIAKNQAAIAELSNG